MKKSFIATAVTVLCFLIPAYSAPVFTGNNEGSGLSRTAEAGFAEEEFRRGVQSYYRGFFNDAIIQFEKALAYLPDENLILDWLGKAYYRAGLEGSALEQWQFARDAGYGGLLLENRIETVRERRVSGISEDIAAKYTETGSFSGKNGEFMIFSQPVSVLSNSDGTFWVAAYGSNELLLLDINGNVISRVTGPVNGFDRPVDIIRLNDGNLLLSESAGDRLSVLDRNGRFVKYIGKKGRGLGEFVGPQFVAQDSLGNIYATDFGNRRVCVFDKDGNGLFAFGGRNLEFDGLKGPTGIAILNDMIYVADSVSGAIYEFDLSGNYTGLLSAEGTFKFPEALKYNKETESLIVSDKSRIYSVDIGNGAVYENAYTGAAPSRITSAVPDQNGNIVASDLISNEVFIMARMTDLLGGLYVEIERIDAERFPNVTLEVRVQNRRRQPVVGLRAENFFITEEKRPVASMKFEGAADSNEKQDIIIVIDRSMNEALYSDALNSAMRELASSMRNVGRVSVISSGSIPVTEYTGNAEGLLNFNAAALKSPVSKSCAFDLSIRLAANELINAEPKRAVIYITDGEMSQNAFDRYGLTDLTAYMNNNGISFSVIQLAQGSCAEEISYMTKNTHGRKYYVYRPEGLSGVINDLLEIPNGLYRFSYESALPTDLGRSFLPVEIETYIMNRSGRDETGYFAPLE